MTTGDKAIKVKRKRCYVCKELKHLVDLPKRPMIDNIQYYVCSDECWKKYMDQWLSNRW